MKTQIGLGVNARKLKDLPWLWAIRARWNKEMIIDISAITWNQNSIKILNKKIGLGEPIEVWFHGCSGNTEWTIRCGDANWPYLEMDINNFMILRHQEVLHVAFVFSNSQDGSVYVFRPKDGVRTF
jgi:hypothetical protein